MLLREIAYGCLGSQLTDCISNSWLYKKCGSILLSRTTMTERLRWLGHVL